MERWEKILSSMWKITKSRNHDTSNHEEYTKNYSIWEDCIVFGVFGNIWYGWEIIPIEQYLISSYRLTDRIDLIIISMRDHLLSSWLLVPRTPISIIACEYGSSYWRTNSDDRDIWRSRPSWEGQSWVRELPIREPYDMEIWYITIDQSRCLERSQGNTPSPIADWADWSYSITPYLLIRGHREDEFCSESTRHQSLFACMRYRLYESLREIKSGEHLSTRRRYILHLHREWIIEDIERMRSRWVTASQKPESDTENPYNNQESSYQSSWKGWRKIGGKLHSFYFFTLTSQSPGCLVHSTDPS